MGIHCKCLDMGSVFVMLESRLSFEYLFYHSLEPIPSTPRLARVPDALKCPSADSRS